MINGYMPPSATCEWETPQDLFDYLDSVYHFDLDPCSTDENAKCAMHYTREDDGLKQDWGGRTVFCNPPYGRELGKWVQKAYEEAHKPNTKVLLLVPARTDTAWFHDYCLCAPEQVKIFFLRGRLKFGGAKNNAPFPSMLVLYDFSYI